MCISLAVDTLWCNLKCNGKDVGWWSIDASTIVKHCLARVVGQRVCQKLFENLYTILVMGSTQVSFMIEQSWKHWYLSVMELLVMVVPMKTGWSLSGSVYCDMDKRYKLGEQFLCPLICWFYQTVNSDNNNFSLAPYMFTFWIFTDEFCFNYIHPLTCQIETSTNCWLSSKFGDCCPIPPFLIGNMMGIQDIQFYKNELMGDL